MYLEFWVCVATDAVALQSMWDFLGLFSEHPIIQIWIFECVATDAVALQFMWDFWGLFSEHPNVQI